MNPTAADVTASMTVDPQLAQVGPLRPSLLDPADRWWQCPATLDPLGPSLGVLGHGIVGGVPPVLSQP